MKIFPHNYNKHSFSGPNKFTKQLFGKLETKNNVKIVDSQKEANIEFCLIQQSVKKIKPMVLRLDGIYFNLSQDYDKQNAPIKYAYDNADAVIFQSNFNKILTENWFGEHKNNYVIHNAADLHIINDANPRFWDDYISSNIEIWTCASSWRPHKRLKDNIRYFMEHAPKDAILCIAGEGATSDDFSGWSVDQFKRIKYLGNLDYITLTSLYRRSTTFIHLAYMDHCPNVVVDAQAAGCKVICSSSGGTKEIVSNGLIIQEKEWDYKPIRLYEPPVLDFKNYIDKNVKNDYSLLECSKRYYNVFKDIRLDEN